MAKKKKAAGKKPVAFSLVAISPKTGKAIRPKAGREIFLGLKSGKKLTKITAEYSQKYSKREFSVLKKYLNRVGINHFVLHEALTSDSVIGVDGKPVLTKSKKRGVAGKPLYKTKLVAPRLSKAKVRPIEYRRGKKFSEIDFGFHVRSRREVVDASLFHIPLSPKKKYSKKFALTGDTIKEAVKKIRPGVSAHTLNKHKKILRVDGVIYIPVKDEKTGKMRTDAITFGVKVDMLVNFTNKISQAIRFRLADYGYRFTSMATLNKIMLDEEIMDEQGIITGKGFDLYSIGRRRTEAGDLPMDARRHKKYPVSVRFTSYMI